MSTIVWRRLLLTLCAVTLILTGVNLWMATTLNVSQITTTATSPFNVFSGKATRVPFVDGIVVTPGSPADRAGLRTGDLIDLRKLPAPDRYRWFTGWWLAGEHMQVPVLRGNTTRRISMAAEMVPLNWDVWLGYIGVFTMLLVAAAIAWRRADSSEARTLALLLILYNFGVDFFPIDWITPWPALDAALAGFYVIVFYASFALLATYAMLFAGPPTLLRRILAWFSYASAGIAALYGIAYVVGVWTLSADPTHAWFSGALPQLVTGVLPLLFPVLCAMVTVAQTRGAERARIAWASASVGLLYIVFLATGTLVAFVPSFNSRIVLYLTNAVTFIAPIGLAYSLLNRRILDIGFAINRAVVFSTVSVILVGTFVLVEWLLTDWLNTESHTTNILISAALALALGLSVRAIHKRVDHVLDWVFFRKRREDEESLRTFAHEAAFITDAAVLLSRAVATLERHADASFVTLALDDGAGRYGPVSENDPAIVALRAGRKVLDLHTLNSDLRGEFAYCMRARGRLMGALVLGPKRSGDSYAPDESAAIAQLANGVGDALDLLSAKDDGSRESVVDAMRSMKEQLSEEIRSLAERLGASSPLR